MFGKFSRILLRAGFVVLLVCSMGNSGCGTSSGDIIAQTRSGPVQGTRHGGAYAFLGIPYAASTAGVGRWASPRRESSWSDVRDATQFGPICPQIVEMDMGTELMSEDCLSLNVWTPEKGNDALLPVMVMVPGGGYVFGAGSQPVYNGASLAQKGVALVTVNYRVNAFGFMAHPEMPAGANFGLQDIIAALRWVQASIREFGGDPDNVTIMGLSAGASAVTHLASMPEAAGLFQRVISMSGTSPGDYYVTKGLTGSWTQAAATGLALQNLVGANNLDAFRNVDFKTVLAAAQSLNHPFAPVMDGRLITTPARTALNSLNPVDIMVGSLPRDSIGVMPVASDPDEYARQLGEYFHGKRGEVAQLYPASSNTEAESMSVFTLTTAGFTEPARYVARQAALRQGWAYRYYFTAVPFGPNGKNGAVHATDLGYVFGYATPENGYSEQDAALTEIMQAYVVNFAATGNPNGQGLPNWPRFRMGDQSTLQIDTTGMTVRNGIDEEDCDFFESIYPAIPVDNP